MSHDNYKRKVVIAHKALIQRLDVRKVQADGSPHTGYDSYPVYMNTRYRDTSEELAVTLSVDWNELFKFLAAKARKAKGRRSSALRGMVKLKIDKATVLASRDSPPFTVPDKYKDNPDYVVTVKDIA